MTDEDLNQLRLQLARIEEKLDRLLGERTPLDQTFLDYIERAAKETNPILEELPFKQVSG